MDVAKTRSENYFQILAGASNKVNWLCLAILTIIATNIAITFVWHLGENTGFYYSKERTFDYVDKIMKLRSDTSRSAEITSEDIKSLCNLNVHINNAKDCCNSKRHATISDIDTAHLHHELNYLKGDILGAANRLQAMQMMSLPFLNIPMTSGDFVITYLLIGLVFLFWLNVVLSYTRNALKEFINTSEKASDIANYSALLPSLFYIILPISESRKSYRYLEILILSFLFSTILLLFSDQIEVYWFSPLQSVPISKIAGFKYYAPFIGIRDAIDIGILIVIMYAFVRFKTILKDIRNLLLLLRWESIALGPAMYKYFMEKKIILKKGENDITYRIINSDNENHLCLNLRIQKNNAEVVSEFIRGKVDLAKSFKEFLDDFHEQDTLNIYKTDPETGIAYTSDEIRMQIYFEEIFEKSKYEPDFFSSVSNIVGKYS